MRCAGNHLAATPTPELYFTGAILLQGEQNASPQDARALLREFAGYLAVQSVGFAANFSVFTAMVVGLPGLDGRLLPPSIAGTVAGLVVNYLGAKHLVYRRRARAS